MPKAVRFHKTGGPEVLVLDDVTVGNPGPDEARVKHTAIGLNFIDTYHRSGLYPLPLPSGVGLEGAGVVEAVGANVTWVKAGDRVAYAGGPPGAYSEVRLVPAHRLVKIPDGVSDKTAAAAMLKGLTVQYLIRSTYKVKSGQTVLFHAAAGGVGLIAGQWLKASASPPSGRRARTKAKVASARLRTRDRLYKEQFAPRVKEITGGKGVPVVYDSVGRDLSWALSTAPEPRDLLAVFGNGSGPVSAFDLNLLSKGLYYVTRPTLMTYTAKREDLEAGAAELFDVIKRQGQDRDQSDLRAQGCGAGASRPREPEDHRVYDSGAVARRRRMIEDPKGKVELITGSSTGRCGRGGGVWPQRGQGCRALQQEQGRSREGLRRDRESWRQAMLVQGDVTKSAVCKDIVDKTAQSFGRIDVLITNAGGLVQRAPVEQITDELFDQVLSSTSAPPRHASAPPCRT
jgi:NADPH2:quinone reductase